MHVSKHGRWKTGNQAGASAMVAYLCSVSAVLPGAMRGACPGVTALECVGSQAPWHDLCKYEPICQFSARVCLFMRPAALVLQAQQASNEQKIELLCLSNKFDAHITIRFNHS